MLIRIIKKNKAREKDKKKKEDDRKGYCSVMHRKLGEGLSGIAMNEQRLKRPGIWTSGREERKQHVKRQVK